MQFKLKNILVLLTIMTTLIGTLTAIMSYVNLLPTQDFLSTWLKAFSFAFIVMLPMGIVLFSSINKLINKFFPSLSDIQKKLSQGIVMAVIMELLLAIVTTLINHGYQGHSHFFGIVGNSFIYAIPVGITFACLMTLVLQPKLARFLATPA